MTRILFLGTPEAAVPTLAGVAKTFDSLAIISRPDAARGRSRRPQPSAVSAWAQDRGMEVHKPSSRAELLGVLHRLGPFDLGLVVAYGMLIPPQALTAVEHGFLNLHFSLLPRWRGAAPVERALMAGDRITGITIIKLDEGLDTGPVLTAQAVDVRANETGGELTERLGLAGAALMLRTIGDYLTGSVLPVPQSDEGAKYAPKLSAADRTVGISNSTEVTMNRVRALAPRPGATIEIEGRTHKLLSVAASDEGVPPGLVQVRGGRPLLGLDDGALEILRLQPAGKPLMEGSAWANGLRQGTMSWS